MGIKPSAPESPDVEAAARVEAETNRLAADTETWANRPDQNGPEVSCGLSEASHQLHRRLQI